MSELSLCLRQYAEAIDKRDRMVSWIKDYGSKVESVSVTWNTASALDGYKDVADAVGRQVRNRFEGLTEAALREQVDLVNGLAAKLQRLQQEGVK